VKTFTGLRYLGEGVQFINDLLNLVGDTPGCGVANVVKVDLHDRRFGRVVEE